ncbi:MAG: TolC family protein, partial [Bdellovibrionaceae bacterium]|nr:TolC family protein [Pseudobdellovibrionaceae bacterium]
MKPVNWVLLILILLAIPGPRSEAAPETRETINFQQSLERAEQKSPAMQSLKLRAQNAELASKTAWATLFPTIDLQAAHTYSQQNTSPYFSTAYRHAPWSNQAGVSINENLYDNGVSWRQGRIADLEE